ncbi:MAG TPA: hypothetical protein VLS45_01950, partial [Methylomicrobium sp.]|nr:hypothetical protein [Methylomicrobium sp.]
FCRGFSAKTLQANGVLPYLSKMYTAEQRFERGISLRLSWLPSPRPAFNRQLQRQPVGLLCRSPAGSIVKEASCDPPPMVSRALR